MTDKRTSLEDIVQEMRDGMTIGIGGWGSTRKPMAAVRAILRSSLKDLTVVTYGGPDLGLLCAAGKVKRAIYGFASLESIPLEPNFRRTRQAGLVDATELDEGMLQWGLQAAAMRVGFLPCRAGLGSDVIRGNDLFRQVRDPYSGEELLAMPALPLDVAFVHANRADKRGNAAYLGADWFFDDLYCMAAERAVVTCEEIVDDLGAADFPPTSIALSRLYTAAVVEAPLGAHFTRCPPDYERDETFQAEYAAASRTAEGWEQFRARYLECSEVEYRNIVSAAHG